ncbi:hypothetical protein T484DRAFT_1807373 [Baffinella frigidus]|nr:hypothetical protein T484DRAFT_1807373 [Cryptophyta sp. CCMP2293]
MGRKEKKTFKPMVAILPGLCENDVLPASALATHTTPAFLPDYSSQEMEKGGGAACGTPDQPTHGAQQPSWGRNSFASFAQPMPALAMPQPAFLSGSSVQERGAVPALDPPANTTSASHDSMEETSVVPTSLLLKGGAFRLRGELVHVVPHRVSTDGAGAALAFVSHPASGLSATPRPGPGWSVQETETDRFRPPAASLVRTISKCVSMRGAVLALDPPANTPSTGDTSGIPTSLVLPRGTFNLRGEMTHAFVSYRVATEGGAGNGLSGLLAEKIRALSIDNTQELQIPRHGWGIWPQGAKTPVPFRPEEAKVFLDRDCKP